MVTSEKGIALKQSKNVAWNAVVRFLLVRDGGFCTICGALLNNQISIDHIIPVSRGGLDLLDNFRLVHLKCNISHFRKHFKSKRNPHSEQTKILMSERTTERWRQIKNGLLPMPHYAPGVRSASAYKRWEVLSPEERREHALKIWEKRRKNAHENQQSGT